MKERRNDLNKVIKIAAAGLVLTSVTGCGKPDTETPEPTKTPVATQTPETQKPEVTVAPEENKEQTTEDKKEENKVEQENSKEENKGSNTLATNTSHRGNKNVDKWGVTKEFCEQTWGTWIDYQGCKWEAPVSHTRPNKGPIKVEAQELSPYEKELNRLNGEILKATTNLTLAQTSYDEALKAYNDAKALLEGLVGEIGNDATQADVIDKANALVGMKEAALELANENLSVAQSKYNDLITSLKNDYNLAESAAQSVLTDAQNKAQTLYDEQVANSQAKYDKVVAEAQALKDEAYAKAEAEYNAVVNPATDEYNKKVSEINETYKTTESALDTVRDAKIAEAQKVRDEKIATAQTVKDEAYKTAQAKYDKATEDARLQLEASKQVALDNKNNAYTEAQKTYDTAVTEANNDPMYLEAKEKLSIAVESQKVAQEAKDTAQSNFKKAEEAVKTAEAEKAAKDQAVKDAQGVATQKQAELETANKELADAKKALETATGDKAAAEQAVKNAQTKVAEAQQGVDTANTNLTKANEAKELGQQRIANAQKALEEAEAKLAQAQAQIAKGALGFYESQKNPDGTYSKDVQLAIDIIKYASSDAITDPDARTDTSKEGDAASLENMKYALDKAWLEEYEKLRNEDNNFDNSKLGSVYISNELMALAQANANGSETIKGGGHYQQIKEHFGLNYGENMAGHWDQDNPNEMWYTNEKKVYDYLKEQSIKNGGEGTDREVRDLYDAMIQRAPNGDVYKSEEIKQLADQLGLAGPGHVKIGHYLNATEAYEATGLGVNTENKDVGMDGVVDHYHNTVQDFGALNPEDRANAMTIADYKKLFMEYYNSVKQAQADAEKLKKEAEKALNDLRAVDGLTPEEIIAIQTAEQQLKDANGILEGANQVLGSANLDAEKKAEAYTQAYNTVDVEKAEQQLADQAKQEADQAVLDAQGLADQAKEDLATQMNNKSEKAQELLDKNNALTNAKGDTTAAEKELDKQQAIVDGKVESALNDKTNAETQADTTYQDALTEAEKTYQEQTQADADALAQDKANADQTHTDSVNNANSECQQKEDAANQEYTDKENQAATQQQNDLADAKGQLDTTVQNATDKLEGNKANADNQFNTTEGAAKNEQNASDAESLIQKNEADAQAQAEYDKVVGDAQAQLDQGSQQAQAELDKVQAEKDQAQQEADQAHNAQDQVTDTSNSLDKAEVQLENAQNALDKAETDKDKFVNPDKYNKPVETEKPVETVAPEATPEATVKPEEKPVETVKPTATPEVVETASTIYFGADGSIHVFANFNM